MKKLVFDSSSIISLANNCFFSFFKKLKTETNCELLVGKGVCDEIITSALRTKKFRLQAYRIKKLLDNQIFKTYSHKDLEKKTKQVLEITNQLLKVNNHFVKIIHYGEAECIAISLLEKIDLFVVDERTTRYLLEDLNQLKKLIESRIHSKIEINEPLLIELNKLTKKTTISRSTELAKYGFDKKFFPKFKNDKKFLEGLLWSLKLNGCAINEKEIKQYLK